MKYEVVIVASARNSGMHKIGQSYHTTNDINEAHTKAQQVNGWAKDQQCGCEIAVKQKEE